MMIREISYQDFVIINQATAELYSDKLPLQNRLINFLQFIMSEIYYDRATIFFFYRDTDNEFRKHSSISIHWEKVNKAIKEYDDYYCKYDDSLPILEQDEFIIFGADDFFEIKKRKDNVYWKDYLVPNKCIHSLEGNILLKNDIGLKSGFAFYRAEEKHDFEERDYLIMQLFQPHLSSILKYYGDTNDPNNNSFMFEDNAFVGVTILDHQFQTIRSTNTYKEVLEKYDPNMTYKVRDLCYKMTNANKTSVIHSIEDGPVIIEINKISIGKNVQYCCMVYDISDISKQVLAQTKSKYDLTIREFEILQLVLKGKSNIEISEELYLSLPTVKKYLTSIYSKMDIKNQKQLLSKLNLI